MNWYFEALKKYAVFKGRARRKAFWMFWLFDTLIPLGFIAIAYAIYESGAVEYYDPTDTVESFAVVYRFGTIIPAWAVTVRRLHDTGRSGDWLLGLFLLPLIILLLTGNTFTAHLSGYFFYLIPASIIVAYIVLFVFLVQNSQPGKNRYGSNPEAV